MPKKSKKVIKRSMTIQGFNLQGSNNLIRNALVENNTAESGNVEEELIIQGFNITENSNNNVLENSLARDNKVVSYEPETEITNWQNIHSSFTLELVQKWQTFGFTADQCKSWINTSNQSEQSIQEPLYYVWLRDLKSYTPESLLESGRRLELRKEYEQFLEFQMGETLDDEKKEVGELKLKVIQLLTEIKAELNNYQIQLHQLQTENEQLQISGEQLTNSNIFLLLEAQLTKNESIVREKQGVVEQLQTKIKWLKIELGVEWQFQSQIPPK